MATSDCTNKSTLIDLTGQRFGAWTAIRRDKASTHKMTYWMCRCECGTMKSVRRDHLRNGETTSCGCRFHGIDMAGRDFGRLTVIERSSKKRAKVYWVCACECGKIVTIESLRLRNGQTASCGCYHREQASILNKKHGLSKTLQYHSWAHMIARCTNPKNPAYSNYGGRGIYVCERWLTVTNFLDDMGAPPSQTHSIDRINNNGSYTCGKCQQCQDCGQPNNCRWATRFEQSCNRRTNRLLTHNGETLTVQEWSIRTGLKRSTIEVRMRLGWPVSRIFATPPRRQKPAPLAG